MPKWVKWVHHITGLIHCPECLMLDGCWFLFEKAPIWPHHEKCHCTLEAIDYLVVLMNATAKSNYSKFDPYLFNTMGIYRHRKNVWTVGIYSRWCKMVTGRNGTSGKRKIRPWWIWIGKVKPVWPADQYHHWNSQKGSRRNRFVYQWVDGKIKWRIKTEYTLWR